MIPVELFAVLCFVIAVAAFIAGRNIARREEKKLYRRIGENHNGYLKEKQKWDLEKKEFIKVLAEEIKQKKDYESWYRHLQKENEILSRRCFRIRAGSYLRTRMN